MEQLKKKWTGDCAQQSLQVLLGIFSDKNMISLIVYSIVTLKSLHLLQKGKSIISRLILLLALWGWI